MAAGSRTPATRTGRVEVWVQGYPDGVAVRSRAMAASSRAGLATARELYYLRGDSVMAVAMQSAGRLSFSAPVEAVFRTLCHATASRLHVVRRCTRWPLPHDRVPGGQPANSGSEGIVVVQIGRRSSSGACRTSDLRDDVGSTAQTSLKRAEKNNAARRSLRRFRARCRNSPRWHDDGCIRFGEAHPQRSPPLATISMLRVSMRRCIVMPRSLRP
jgi:hypothetical protein